MEGLKETRAPSGEGRRQGEEEEVELPTESSPYVQHKDVDDYKLRGYGVQGHQQPVEQPRGAGGTDAPTMAGSGLKQAQADATDAINHQGVP